MTCPACAAAQHNPHSGLTYANCHECQAREVARAHKDSDPKATGDRIERLFPRERWAEMKIKAWRWVKRMRSGE